MQEEDYTIEAIGIILSTIKLNQELAESNIHVSNRVYQTIKNACHEKLEEIAEAIELDKKITNKKEHDK